MKVLQINGYESPGRRFNCISIKPLLKVHDIDSQHLVCIKDTQNSDILTFDGQSQKRLSKKLYNYIDRAIRFVIGRLEQIMSLQSVLYPHAHQIMRMSAFKKADLLHLHIIHSGFMSLSDLQR